MVVHIKYKIIGGIWMPSAWVVGSMVIRTSLLLLIVSFIVGIIVYYIFSPLDKKERKQHLDWITTLLVVFIISLWIGKGIKQYSILFSHPLSVIVYPADRWVFYIAVALLVGYIILMKFWKDKGNLNDLYAGLYILFTAQFVYEFIHYIAEEQTGYIWLVFLYGMLVALLVFLNQREEKLMIASGLMGICSIGNILYGLFYEGTLFHFYTDVWFWSVWLVISVRLFVFARQREMHKPTLKEEAKG